MSYRMAIVIASMIMISSMFIIINIDEAEGVSLNGITLTTRDPIVIDGNSDFTSANGISSGSGTENDPYIIENFRISLTDSDGIDIKNTDDHFIIRNCWITGDYGNGDWWYFGVKLTEVLGGLVENCKFETLTKGVYGYDSGIITVHNNTVNNCGDGIGFYESSQNITITNNNIYGCGMAIQLRTYVSHCFVANNTCIRSKGVGIDLRSNCDHNIVEYNDCLETYDTFGNDMNGIGIDLSSSSNRNIIRFNNCNKNSGSGIRIGGSAYNQIYDNIMIENRATQDYLNRYGISISQSRSNIFKRNTIIDCGIYVEIDVNEKNISSSNSIDTTNTVNGKGIRVISNSITAETISGDIGPLLLFNCENKVIRNLDVFNIPSYLHIQDCSKIDIEDSTFDYTASGMDIYNSQEIRVMDCTFNGFRFAIFVEGVSDSHISNNTFTSGSDGITGYGISDSYVEYNQFSKVKSGFNSARSGNCIKENILEGGVSGFGVGNDNRILNNLIDSFSENGIGIGHGGNQVKDNLIVGCDVGIYIRYKSAALIERNMILNNRIGIHSNYDLSEDVIRENNISLNKEYGIDLESRVMTGIPIYNNSFFNNNGGGVQVRDLSRNCTWDDGVSSGNYWSDYESRYVPPAVNNNVTWNLTYIVDGGDTNGDNYPLIDPPVEFDPILIVSKNNQEDAQVSKFYNVSYTAIYSGSPDDVTWSFSTNAPFLYFTPHNYLSGSGLKAHIGVYWVNISVRAGNLMDYTNFTVSLGIKNYPPVITTTDLTTATQWTLYKVDYDATDDETDLEWQLVTEASFLSINKETGVLSGTPGLNDVGTFEVNVSVNDGDLWDITHFDLYVVDVNDPPMMNSSMSLITMDEDSTYTLPVLNLFFNHDNDPLTVTVTDSSNVNATVINGTTLQITAPDDWHGTGSISFLVSDNSYNKTFGINVVVNSVNDPPEDLVISIPSTTLSVTGNQTVSASYFDPDLGDNASVSWYVDGILVSNSTIYNLSLPAGNYTLTLRITDSNGDYSETSVQITVAGEGSPPVVYPDDDGPDWTLIVIISLLIAIFIVFFLLVIIRRRGTSVEEEPVPIQSVPSMSRRPGKPGGVFDPPAGPDNDMLKSGLIGSDVSVESNEIPWFNGSDVDMEDLMGEAFENEHNSTHNTSLILKRLKKKQRNGDLSDEEFGLLKDVIERIKEE